MEEMMLRILFFTYVLSFALPPPLGASAQENYQEKRIAMVSHQIQRRGIVDEQVLRAMRKVERHLFIPRNLWHLAYQDHPVSIGRGQTISQPYIVAFMTEAARLKPGDRVLEIGTGSGYQAAVLGEIVDEVYSVEIIEEMAKGADKRLKSLGYRNIFVRHGDGYLGWSEHSPFDAILVTAAPEVIPRALVDQLKEGGHMVIPVGADNQDLLLVSKTKSGIKEEKLLGVRFVPMVQE